MLGLPARSFQRGSAGGRGGQARLSAGRIPSSTAALTEELRLVAPERAAGLVDVPEDVQPRPDLAHPAQEVLAAHRAPALVAGLVEDARRRPVGDQHVQALGDERPLLGQRRAARQVEGPVQKPRLPRASPEAQAAGLHRLVLQVDRRGQRAARGLSNT